jgi:hypothetical protein
MRRPSLVLIALLCVAACGKKSPTGPDGGGGGGGSQQSAVHSCAGGTLSGYMTATIDGTSFVATCLVNLNVISGLVSFGATNVAQSNPTGFIDIAFGVKASAPGTYQLAHMSINDAAVSIGGSKIWQAGATSNGTGTVVFTTLTATEIAGTFSLDLVAGPNASGTKTVRNGSFDFKS